MLQGFKQFLMKGNVVDLAVAVVMGAAFGAVVTAFVQNLLTPLIAAIAGKPNFSEWKLVVGSSEFLYGEFLNALISFLMVAAAVYFFVVLPMNSVMARMKKDELPAAPTTKACPECLSEIPLAARRCAHCTSPLTSAASAGN
ncbi:MAG: large conductance mechanosensitive channel protein MscL [Candidatus Korobacteraceae bacterium]